MASSPEDSVANLAAGSTLADDVAEMDYKANARRELIEGLEIAVQGLLSLAQYSENPSAQLKACTYIIERALGPASKGTGDNEDDPLQKLVEDLQNADPKLAD